MTNMKHEPIDLEHWREQVRGPGKFEGEAPECAYFYSNALQYGDGDVLWSDEHSSESITYLEADEYELIEFDAPPDAVGFVIHETTSGFVCGWWVSAAERDELEHELGELDALEGVRP